MTLVSPHVEPLQLDREPTPFLAGFLRRHQVFISPLASPCGILTSETGLVMPETMDMEIDFRSLFLIYKVSLVFSKPHCKFFWPPSWTCADLYLSFSSVVSSFGIAQLTPSFASVFRLLRSSSTVMGLGRLVGLASASLATLSMAEDLLFYNNLLYQEYTQATTVLGFTGNVAAHSCSKDRPY